MAERAVPGRETEPSAAATAEPPGGGAPAGSGDRSIRGEGTADRRREPWNRTHHVAFIFVSLLVCLGGHADVVFGGKTFLSVGTLYGVYAAPPYASGYTGKAPAHFGGLDAGSQAWAVHPWAYLERRAVARGELPLWNRHNGLGEPFLANGQVALLNPFHWIVLADPDSPALWDLHFLLLRFVSALFTCYLLFRLGAPIPIAACGAVPGALHGSFISLVNRADLAAYAVMPLVLYAVVRLRQAPRLRNAALLAGALYLAVTAGHPQPSVAVLLPSGAIGLALLVRERRGRMLGAAAALIAALVTAPYWLPFLANLRGSWTSHGPGTAAAVEPRIALQWIVPGIFASHHMTAFLDGPTPARSFLGAVLGLIAMVGLFAPIATHRRVVWAGTGLALTLLLFGAPAFDALLRLPLLSRVSPAYFEFPALFLLTCAGLLALEDLRNATPRARIAVVLCAFLLVAGALSLAPVWVPQGLFPGFGRQLALYLPIAAASAALAFAAASANRTPGWQAGCAILLLLGAATELASYRYPLSDRGNPTAEAPYVAWLKARQREDPALRVMGLGDYFLPNHATAFGLDDVRLCDALVPARHQTLVQRLLQQDLLNGWLVYASPWTGFRFPNPALDLLAVRYVIVSSAAYPDYVRRHGVAYTDAEFRGGMILENPTAWPRIFALDVPIRESSPAAALDRVERELGRGPFAVVEADFPAVEWERLCARGCGGLSTRVEGIRFGANDLTLDAEVSGPAVLTVTDTLTEGWEASVDGVAAPLFHVNYAFRGILLPPGRHAVRFWYAPGAWTIAWILAALGCLSGGGLSVAAIARGRSRRERVVH